MMANVSFSTGIASCASSNGFDYAFDLSRSCAGHTGTARRPDSFRTQIGSDRSPSVDQPNHAVIYKNYFHKWLNWMFLLHSLLRFRFFILLPNSITDCESHSKARDSWDGKSSSSLPLAIEPRLVSVQFESGKFSIPLWISILQPVPFDAHVVQNIKLVRFLSHFN